MKTSVAQHDRVAGVVAALVADDAASPARPGSRSSCPCPRRPTGGRRSPWPARPLPSRCGVRTIRKALGARAGDLPGSPSRSNGTALAVPGGAVGHSVHGLTEMPASDNRSLLRGGHTTRGVGTGRVYQPSSGCRRGDVAGEIRAWRRARAARETRDRQGARAGLPAGPPVPSGRASGDRPARTVVGVIRALSGLGLLAPIAFLALALVVSLVGLSTMGGARDGRAHARRGPRGRADRGDREPLSGPA